MVFTTPYKNQKAKLERAYFFKVQSGRITVCMDSVQKVTQWTFLPLFLKSISRDKLVKLHKICTFNCQKDFH